MEKNTRTTVIDAAGSTARWKRHAYHQPATCRRANPISGAVKRRLVRYAVWALSAWTAAAISLLPQLAATTFAYFVFARRNSRLSVSLVRIVLYPAFIHRTTAVRRVLLQISSVTFVYYVETHCHLSDFGHSFTHSFQTKKMLHRLVSVLGLLIRNERPCRCL